METTPLREKTKRVNVQTVFMVFKQVTVHSSGNKSVSIVFKQVTVHTVHSP